jgi:hypothetical protein
MLIGILSLCFWTTTLLMVLTVPTHKRWVDDTDCQRIVQHTVRIPTDLERLRMWQSRYYILEEKL